MSKYSQLTTRALAAVTTVRLKVFSRTVRATAVTVRSRGCCCRRESSPCLCPSPCPYFHVCACVYAYACAFSSSSCARDGGGDGGDRDRLRASKTRRWSPWRRQEPVWRAKTEWPVRPMEALFLNRHNKIGVNMWKLEVGCSFCPFFEHQLYLFVCLYVFTRCRRSVQ